jgi:hypothetical protein
MEFGLFELLSEVRPVLDGIKLCRSIVGVLPKTGRLVTRAWKLSGVDLRESSRIVVMKRTHFNEGIEDQLLLRLAIGSGCHVVGARDHFSFFWRTVIFPDDVRGKM